MSVPRVDMVHNRAVVVAYSFSAPGAGQIPSLPVFVHEADKILPALGFVEGIIGHQKIPGQEICPSENRGAGNSRRHHLLEEGNLLL
jgi:hypothetical protein